MDNFCIHSRATIKSRITIINWEAIGAVGEILGALTVIATLFYLAHQIRQNNQALNRSNEFAQANSIHQINTAYSGVFSHLASDDGLADIYTRALAGEQLTPTEETRFTSFVNMFVATLENLSAQQSLELGYSGLDIDTAVNLMAPYLKKLLETQAGSRWWRKTGPALYVEDFRNQVNKAIAEAQHPNTG
jgi:hypothetical protein